MGYCLGLLLEKLNLLFHCVIYLAAHCCTMAMIDPSVVAMAIRRQLMVVGLTTGSASDHYDMHSVVAKYIF